MNCIKNLFFFLAIIGAFLFSCQNTSTENKVDEKEASIMYEPSELANLMRTMHQQSKSWKNSLIEEETINVEFPVFYERMHTAEATNPKEINENYHAKTDEFLEATKVFVGAQNENKISTYNLMIASCINCHKDFCRGPIQKINKLVIKETI